MIRETLELLRIRVSREEEELIKEKVAALLKCADTLLLLEDGEPSLEAKNLVHDDTVQSLRESELVVGSFKEEEDNLLKVKKIL